jgi:protein-S-isoprenylcysteine O-methyltransferase Ste14
MEFPFFAIVMPTPLRIVLLLGLIFHKLVWEVMKRQPGAAPEARKKPEKFGLKAILKAIKTLFLAFLLVQTAMLAVLPISAQAGTLPFVGLFIFALGLAVAVLGRVHLGNNWANLEDYQVLPQQALVRNGIYQYIRHPIYTGDVLLILGLQLALNSWLVLIVVPLAAYVVQQTLAEERVLARAFPGYNEYRKQTKMFIPFVV